ncbi:CBS domain-containing protein [Streptomyces sp. FH025]|uniref:CBS domain-containing protein n=1 Tax=Streptomyces sp. FH025 TaxID=2815937 RepID=UPI001A9D5DE6|nr:CBS domain-containing protein [Streptomyces sp. FH025]MBO1418820.1 CBS domain-containing protein [Streptomyces sp. FH025]
MHRTVQDVMTKEVVVAHRDTAFKDIADLFDRNDISAVPVVDDADHPVGIVSEADLIRAQARQPDVTGRSEARWLPPHGRSRAEAERAGTLMSSPAVTARPEWTLVEAARLMDRRNVKHLPVTDRDGRLVGILSRRDLLRPFLRPDDILRREIIVDVLDRTLRLPPDAVDVTVDNGVVTLTGTVRRKSLVPVVERLCHAVDGVVAVHQTLRYTSDDSHIDIGAA